MEDKNKKYNIMSNTESLEKVTMYTQKSAKSSVPMVMTRHARKTTTLKKE